MGFHLHPLWLDGGFGIFVSIFLMHGLCLTIDRCLYIYQGMRDGPQGLTSIEVYKAMLSTKHCPVLRRFIQPNTVSHRGVGYVILDSKETFIVIVKKDM